MDDLMPIRALDVARRRVGLIRAFWNICYTGMFDCWSGDLGFAVADEQTLIDTYNSNVLNYNSSSRLQLEQSEFNLTTYDDFTSYESAMKQKEYSFSSSVQPGIISYESLEFTFDGQLYSTCGSPVPPFNNAPTGAASINALFRNNSEIISSTFSTNSFPLWKADFISISQSDQSKSDCVTSGGYLEEASSICVYIKIVKSICIAISLSEEGWIISENPGCYFPFQEFLEYDDWNYSNANISFDISVELRSENDPTIQLGKLTKGKLYFEEVAELQIFDGKSLLAIAGVLCVVEILVIVSLYLTQKKWREKRSAVVIPTNAIDDDQSLALITMEKKSLVIWMFALIFMVLLGLGIGVGVPLLNHWSQEAQFTLSAFIGVQLIAIFLPFSYVFLWLFTSSAIKAPWTKKKKISTLGLLLLLCVFVSLFALTFMIKPSAPIGTLRNQRDPLSFFLGWILFCTFIPFGILLIKIIKEQLNHNESPFKSELLTNSDSLPNKDRNFGAYGIHPNSTNKIWSILAIVVLFPGFIEFVTPTYWYLGLFLSSTFLPPIWNVPMDYYLPFVSPYSYTNVTIGGTVTMKVYQDTIVYWTFLYSIILFGFLGTLFPLKNLFQKRFKIFFQFWSIGEISLVFAFLGVSSYWFYFWFVEYKRISQTEIWERLGRTFGHMSNFAMGFLFFPVARNSIWIPILGTSFEKAVAFHRLLGFFTFICWTLHLLSWVVKWYLIGHLDNLISIFNYPHADNWTIPMMFWVTWIPAVVMVFLAYERFRRKRFEWFFYSHHLYLVFLVTTLIHAWSLWYYLIPGLLLYFIDRLVRFSKSSKNIKIVDIRHGFGGHVRLEMKVENFKYRPGQYCFINVPIISRYQWHPFSISSFSFGKSTVTFFIKDMGENTWTNKLSQIALTPWSRDTIIKVDGPYGNPLDCTKSDVVILVCGGIGVTPMFSLLSYLYEVLNLNMGGIKINTKKVYFLWNVRQENALYMFQQTLSEMMLNDSTKNQFSFSISVSKTLNKNSVELELVDGPLSIPFSYGRLDLQDQFLKIEQENRGRFGQDCSIACFACGPSELVKRASELSIRHKFIFHEETFEL